MSTIRYSTEEPVTFCREFDAKGLDPLAQPLGTTVYRDGSCLILKARRTRSGAIMLWYARMLKGTYEGSRRAGSCWQDMLIGDFAQISQGEARDAAKRIAERLRRETGRVEYCFACRTRFFTIWLPGGGTEMSLEPRLNPKFLLQRRELGDADLMAMHAYDTVKGRPKVVALSSHLAVRIHEKRWYTERVFIFTFTDGNGQTSRAEIGDLESMTLATARGIAERAARELALLPPGADRLAAAREAIQRNYAARISADGICELRTGRYAFQRRITVEIGREALERAAGPLDGRGPTWGELVRIWHAQWSKDKSESHASAVLRRIAKYTGRFDEAPAAELLERRELRNIVLALKSANENTAHSLLTGLNMVLDYAAALELVESNPLRKLKPLVRRRQSVPVKSLDPHDLAGGIRTFFRDYASRLKPPYRLLFEILFYTLLRTGELVKIRIGQIARDPRPGFMRLDTYCNKTLDSFSIPLTPYAQELFAAQERSLNGAGGGWYFPAKRDPKRHLDSRLIPAALNALGCQILKPHGIRAVGAAFFASRDDIQYQAGMACLQHSYTSGVHLRYDRTFLYEQRVGAMAKWSDFLQDSIGPYSALRRM